MAKAVNLQVNDDMALQDAVIEDKVSLKVVLIHQDAALPRFKAKALAHLEQEVLQMIKNLAFQFALGEDILLLQSQKLQRHRVMDSMLRL